MKKKDFKKIIKKIWHFLWHDNSIWSWIVNILLAVIIIKFIVYPVLGLTLGTSYPVVAVVSTSMEHLYEFDDYWHRKGYFYQQYNISKEDFEEFIFKNGFNKGDIMIIMRVVPERIEVGDVIVFQSKKPEPIIHRVIDIIETKGVYYFTTKGDNNQGINTLVDERRINESRVIGKAIFRIPYLGYLKMSFVEFLKFIHLA